MAFSSFSARDEDAGQSLTYSLTNGDNGRFRVDSQGRLFKAKDVDYETQNYHVISAKVLDNGNPSMGVRELEIYLTNRFHVAVRLFSNRSQMTSKCGKNKKVAHEAIAECVTDVLTTF